MKILSFLFLLLCSSLTTTAQDFSAYQKKVFVSGNDTMGYRLLLPQDYDSKKVYPLLLFLHGAGERGNDNEKQLVHGAGLFLVDSIRKKYPAIVVFPQCSADSYWSSMNIRYDSVSKTREFIFDADNAPTKAMELVIKLYKQLKKEFKTNPKKQYVGGLSMGGMGTFEIANRLPGAFAAAFAICGGGDPKTAETLSSTAWWIFHGLKDNVVNPKYSIEMANALKAAGADIRLTLYPEANHNSWDSAFAEPELMPWLWMHHLK